MFAFWVDLEYRLHNRMRVPLQGSRDDWHPSDITTVIVTEYLTVCICETTK